MDINDLRKYFLLKTGVTEEMPFKVAVPVFKVGDKIFGLINIHESDRKSINLKYPKNHIYEIRSIYQEIRPAYHMNKDNWNTIYLDGSLEEDFIKELIDVSYNLVFNSLTKKKQKEILDMSGELYHK